jgi:hypothetical protein
MRQRALQAVKKLDSQASTGINLTPVMDKITLSELVTDYLGFSVPINIPSNITVELTALLTRFLELAIQNSSRGPNILSKMFMDSQSSPRQCRNISNQATIASLHILLNPPFTNQPNIRRCRT